MKSSGSAYFILRIAGVLLFAVAIAANVALAAYFRRKNEGKTDKDKSNRKKK